MSLTSLYFIFVFLPISLAIYYLSNDKIKEYFLFFISLVFYALCSVEHVLVFLFSILTTVIIGRTMEKVICEVGRKALLILGICVNVGLLLYYKYTNFGIFLLNQVFSNKIAGLEILFPLGISFYSFKAVSYLVDIYGKKIVLKREPIHDALYLAFFGQIMSGPISRYDDMYIEENSRTCFSSGVYRFLIGFSKKILLANILANITEEVFATPTSDLTTSFTWLGSVCFSLKLFFDFSGYSDMAIGISQMFGYHCPENFNYPYMTESISKFWRRWHISLSEWFRDYIYIPLGGSRNKNKFKTYFNLFVVWILTGIWHGAALNYIVWGLGYFVMISFERMTRLPDRLNSKISKILYRVFALIFINFEGVMFNSQSLKAGIGFIKKMLSFESGYLLDLRTRFLIKDYFFFIMIAIVLCFPIFPNIGKWAGKRKCTEITYEIFSAIVIALAFILSLSFIVAGQNNPFVYANF